MNNSLKAWALAGALFASSHLGTDDTFPQISESQRENVKKFQALIVDVSSSVQEYIQTLTNNKTPEIMIQMQQEFDKIVELKPEQPQNTCSQEEALETDRRFREKIIVFDWKEYDVSIFYEEILEPIHEFLPDFDLNMLMKIALIENMWYGKKPHQKKYEMEHVLRLFSKQNYLKKLTSESSAGARNIFQTLPSTENFLNKIYKIEAKIAKNKNLLSTKYNIKTARERSAFRSALYGAYQMQFTMDEYLKKNGKPISQAMLAVGYNAWSARTNRVRINSDDTISKKNLPRETRIYIAKLADISHHPEVQIPILPKHPIGV